MASTDNVSRVQVHSSGGGTQSIAIFGLILTGRLPRPDLIVMADTEREASATWQYHEQVCKPALAKAGLEVVILRKSEYEAGAVDDLYKSGRLLIPAFTTQNGLGKLPAYCSDEWKRMVVLRFLRAQGIEAADIWYGMTTDELDRMASSGADWWRKVYPLIGYALWGASKLHHERLAWALPMSRADCYNFIVDEMGWPAPPKSSCWMCPNRLNSQWRDLRDNQPADWQRATAFDSEIRQRDPNVFVHFSGLPLAEANLGDDQPNLFEAMMGGCSSGMCEF